MVKKTIKYCSQTLVIYKGITYLNQKIKTPRPQPCQFYYQIINKFNRFIDIQLLLFYKRSKYRLTVTILIIRYYPFSTKLAIYILYIVSQFNLFYMTLTGSIAYLLFFIPRHNQTKVTILLILAGFHVLILHQYIFPFIN